MTLTSGRIRTLTTKAMAIYEDKVHDFQKRLSKKYEEIVYYLGQEVSTDISVLKLNEYEQNLKILTQAYKSLNQTFDNYLSLTKTEESLKLQNTTRNLFETQKDEIDGFQLVIQETKQQLLKKLLKTTTSTPKPSTAPDVFGEITTYMLKKELLLSRVISFNDSPETYRGWKATFKQVIAELKVSPPEEIDLLIKWLGIDSKKHAVSLKSVFIKQPELGLQRIWERLDERYGSPEAVYKITLQKLEKISKLSNTDTVKWYELADTLSEISALKHEAEFSTALACFDSSVGVAPIVAKLPSNIQEKWAVKVYYFKDEHSVLYPPFEEFVKFVNTQARIRNDPSLQTISGLNHTSTASNGTRRQIFNRKTEVVDDSTTRNLEKFCLLHKSNHSLNKCRVFKTKSFQERKNFLYDQKICFKCCESNKHRASDCKVSIKCGDCDSSNHSSAMHIENHHQRQQPQSGIQQQKQYGGETTAPVNSSCTQICNNNLNSKSCTKLVLVNVCKGNHFVKCYAMLDDQSNASLAKPELFNLLNISGQDFEYTINSCNGTRVAHGRRASGCTIMSLNESVTYQLPTLIECPDIPNNRNEICSPHDVGYHPHLSHIASFIPEIDSEAQILLLIGRDLVEAHHVQDQITGPPGAPFAQKLSLGWVVIGEMCLGKVHSTEQVNVQKTHVLSDGRASLFPPCENRFVVSENVKLDSISFDPVFVQTADDEKPGPSQEDLEFLALMSKEFVLGSNGRWSAPLPFKQSRLRLPNNRPQALQRAKSLQRSLSKNPVKQQHFVEFMRKLFENGHAELAPKLSPGDESWYLPIFGVYNSKKPNKIRVVFDSACTFEGVSLNSVLLQGPDLTNNLLGVLLRFRRETVAISVDIEQMFYCFGVNEKDRNYLKFLWHEDNDPLKPLVEYRMKKHVFGNSPSPAIATYGLQKAVENSDSDVIEFVCRDFYVDDGLTSLPSVVAAIDLVKRTQTALAVTGLRLHKITSNVSDVVKAFPKEDLATDLSKIDFDNESFTSRSLGLEWELNQDYFHFSIQPQSKHATKRALLSAINSIFDPLGFLAPVVIEGRLLLRDVVSSGVDWDDPLPQDIEVRWNQWLASLCGLKQVKIPRCLFEVSISTLSDLELHVFSDASEKAIAAVVYLVGVSSSKQYVSFVMGKVKVAPSKGHTIPRLELCAAVLATELFAVVSENLHVHIDNVSFYTDSRIVLGYIGNQSRRFYTYVSNRVAKIRNVSSPQQWNYIPTEKNPADVGTRGSSPLQLINSFWLSGPQFLFAQNTKIPEFYPLLDPEVDSEVRTIVVAATTVQICQSLGFVRFERFSSWNKLLFALGVLVHIVLSFRKAVQCTGWHMCAESRSLEGKHKARLIVIREVQYNSYRNEMVSLSTQKTINTCSTILPLDPFLDEEGLLRVGGRLSQSSLPFEEKHPIILPAKHHVSKLLIRHFHETVHHQGRHLTEGAVRQGGFWIVGLKRAVSSVIFNCVSCKKSRGKFLSQKMSDLPIDRVQQAAPFTFVGVDVFGPWSVVSRRTRGGQASSKRWSVLFTCLTIRAVHIEVVDEMSSSSFINALRRFISIRGAVKQFRSDRGTNFVGATDLLGIEAINVEDRPIKTFFLSQGCQWVFNPPHASHFGGSWERMIGIARRILESMLRSVTTLTHDVLVTLMAEVTAIINSRPIVPVSSDSDNPVVLSPSMLLTSKSVLDSTSVGNLDVKSLYGAQWKRVQYLAEEFWCKWRKEYLYTLQNRRKWNYEQEPLCLDDVVLLKDREVNRNEWPMARVSRVFPSNDKKLRTVEIVVFKNGKQSTYVRPVHELVLLVKA